MKLLYCGYRKKVRAGGLGDVTEYVKGLLGRLYDSVEGVAVEIGLMLMEGVMEAEKRFRKVKGYSVLPMLIAALE